MKSKNLNEEISRMKLLMGENLLYGNMVDRHLLVEGGKTEFIEKFWKSVSKNIKNGGEIKYKVRKGANSSDFIVIKKGKNGEITFTKNGKKIGSGNDIPRMEDLMSSVGKRELDALLGSLNSEKAIREFFVGENYLESYKIILRDLKEQGLPMSDDFITVIKNSGTGKRLDDYIFGDGSKNFFNDETGESIIKSMEDIKKIHPDFYDYLTDVPGLVTQLDNTLKNSSKVFYDSETVDLARGINKLKSDYVNNPKRKVGDFDMRVTEDSDVIQVSIPKGYVEEVNNTYGLKFKKDVNDPNSYIIEIDKTYYGDKEYSYLKKVVDPKGTDELIDVSQSVSPRVKKKKFITKGGEEQLDDSVKKAAEEFTTGAKYKYNAMRFLTSTDNVDIYNPSWLATKIGKFNSRKGMDYITMIFNNPSFSLRKNLADAFSRKFRVDFDVKKWMKEGYGTSNLINTQKRLSTNQKEYLDSLYVRPDGSAETLITDLDKELLEQGYVKGQVHPNLVIRDNWKDLTYNYLLGKGTSPWYSPKISIANSEYNNWRKTVKRVIVNYAAVGYGGSYFWLPVSYLNWIVSRLMMTFVGKGINDLLESNAYIKADAFRYRINCMEQKQDNISSSLLLSDKLKNDILGEQMAKVATAKGDEKTETKVGLLEKHDIIKHIGVVEFPEGSIGGKTGEYKYVGMKEGDLLPSFDIITDNTQYIVENNLIYPIRNMTKNGDDWKMVKRGEEMGLELHITKDGKDWCGVSETCKTVWFSLECENFSIWWLENKTKIDMDKLTSNMLTAVWDYMFNDQTIIDTIKLKAEEFSRTTIESGFETLDVNDDGDINVKDFNRAVDNVQNAAGNAVNLGGSTNEIGMH